MGKILKIIGIIFGNSPTAAATEESASVRILKKQIKTMEEVMESNSQLLLQYAKQAKLNSNDSMQEKLIEMAGSLFLSPTANTIQSPLAAFGDTGVSPNAAKLRDYTDEELKALILKIPESNKIQIKAAPLEIVLNQARNYIPDISDNSIKKLKEMLEI